MGRELPQRKRPWWTKIAAPTPELSEDLQKPGECDRLMHTILYAAGRTERVNRDLVASALEAGDEAAVVMADTIIQRHRDAVNASIADLKALKARLEQRQERPVDHEA